MRLGYIKGKQRNGCFAQTLQSGILKECLHLLNEVRKHKNNSNARAENYFETTFTK